MQDVRNTVQEKMYEGIFQNLPIKWNYDKSKNTGCDGHVCHKVVDGAIHGSEGPIRVEKKDKVKGAVEQWHHKIRYGEIYQEVISDGAHSAMSCNKK